MSHTLPKLGYAYDALEPHIDARTMEIHHQKHHAAYVTKLNAALEGHSDLGGWSAEELVRKLNQVPSEVRTAVRNHGGGHVNHTFFWSLLKPGVDFKGEIAEAITAKFGGFDSFKAEFLTTAMGIFGSGWAWLVVDSNGELALRSTLNQDNPISSAETPVFGIDVWEHAYYLKYQNMRNSYIEAVFNVTDWKKVNEYYLKTRSTVKSL